MTKPTVLILHSYDKDYAWTRDINIGLNRVLKHRELYQVRWYYMDTKRHPTHEYRTTAGIAARQVIKEVRPDVLIAIDDDAQQFAARHFINDPNIKIVFAGVNKQANDYGYDKANNVTGILERLPLAAISEALQSEVRLKQLQHAIRIAYVGDISPTVAGDILQVNHFNWAPLLFAGVYTANTFPEWQSIINRLSSEVDVIMVTGYRQLMRTENDKSIVPYTEVVAWMEQNSKVPVISGNGFFIEDGGMLAIGTSPYEQGEVAAGAALAIILDAKPIAEIPVVSSQQFIVAMSGAKVQERNFNLPKVYEAAARTGDKFYP